MIQPDTKLIHSGIHFSNETDSNTAKQSYSYRNFNVSNYGMNDDRFSPKSVATNTAFNYCYIWDNTYDGWDPFDKEGDKSLMLHFG